MHYYEKKGSTRISRINDYSTGMILHENFFLFAALAPCVLVFLGVRIEKWGLEKFDILSEKQ